MITALSSVSYTAQSSLEDAPADNTILHVAQHRSHHLARQWLVLTQTLARSSIQLRYFIESKTTLLCPSRISLWRTWQNFQQRALWLCIGIFMTVAQNVLAPRSWWVDIITPSYLRNILHSSITHFKSTHLWVSSMKYKTIFLSQGYFSRALSS